MGALSLSVLLVMDCVTARSGSQVQPTKMTLARQRVLSTASDLKPTLSLKKKQKKSTIKGTE